MVTANKELLANVGAELFAAADAAGVDLLFEAAVAGGIPLIRPLRESLVGERDRTGCMGIVNGTTNYILTRMTEEGASYADALAEAQALGYAERDPTADVEGYDAGAKAAILATHRVRRPVVRRRRLPRGHLGDHRRRHRLRPPPRLRRQAARRGRAADAPTAASACGCTRRWSRPSHPLAAVRETFNAVFIEGEAVGELMFYGRGAGGAPTASAVLGDLIDAAVNLRRGTHAAVGSAAPRPRIRPIDELAVGVLPAPRGADRPGVLAAVAGVFGATASRSARWSRRAWATRPAASSSPTRAREADMQATLHELRGLDPSPRSGRAAGHRRA